MITEFDEFQVESLRTRGYIMLDDIARKSSDNSWETVRMQDGKIYHQGKDVFGKKIDGVYNSFGEWEEAQNIRDQQWLR